MKINVSSVKAVVPPRRRDLLLFLVMIWRMILFFCAKDNLNIKEESFLSRADYSYTINFMRMATTTNTQVI